MATPIDYVDKQWAEWQDKNNHTDHVDTIQLKNDLIEDLKIKSAMDVREYTLYQKWCEIHERYPVEEVSTVFGQEVQMVDLEQEKLIKEVKSNFWMPQSPDDYENLRPVMQIYNGELAETWNAIRTFSSTMKNNSNIGRNLFYTIIDGQKIGRAHV